MYRSKYICGFLAFASAVLGAIFAALYYTGIAAVLVYVALGFIAVLSAIALLLLLVFALHLSLIHISPSPKKTPSRPLKRDWGERADGN